MRDRDPPAERSAHVFRACRSLVASRLCAWLALFRVETYPPLIATSPLRLPEQHPADKRGDDHERQRDADTPGESGAAVGQEMSDTDPAPRPEGGTHRG